MTAPYANPPLTPPLYHQRMSLFWALVDLNRAQTPAAFQKADATYKQRAAELREAKRARKDIP